MSSDSSTNSNATASSGIGSSSMSDLLNQELRRVDVSKLTKLSAIIDETDSWRTLLEELTKPNRFPGYESCQLKLNLNAINLIKQQRHCDKSPTLALLNHWAITGRRRPTVYTLLWYLHKCNLKRAEDFVCISVLGVKSIDQLLSKTSKQQSINSPSQPLQLTSTNYRVDLEYKFDDLEILVKELAGSYDSYYFEEIYKSTNRFCHQVHDRITNQGHKIGEGRFSSVYRAETYKVDTQDKKIVIAAKLLKSDCNKKYLVNEIKLVKSISHENILELLGISIGGTSPEVDAKPTYMCLIYPYMKNGSLLDCLSKGLPTRNMEYIRASDRYKILYKIAQGIAYLHSIPSGAIIHRDIKTANILIDDNIEPKIGDFTLVRQLDEVLTAETQFSQNIIGTSVYMPPEAFRGDISIKFDTFSYGIVLLEVLTGMRPFNKDEDEDLFTFINEKLSDIEDEYTGSSFDEARDKFLMSTLDNKAGSWEYKKCKALFNISLKATESRKKDRPEMKSLVPLIENALHDHLINWTDNL